MCGAHTRSTGQHYRVKALGNGRCEKHGGMRTGPKTPAGRQAIGQPTRQRMASVQRKKALKGFYRWLEGESWEMLSKLTKGFEVVGRKHLLS